MPRNKNRSAREVDIVWEVIYEDCDRCGERYLVEEGESESRWLRDEQRTPSKHFDETWRVCCPK